MKVSVVEKNRKEEGKFTCPQCGQVQTKEDFIKNGLNPETYYAKVCIGRWEDASDCDWEL
ncbi:MAG: hypothetical protein GY754_42915 [bacterium]|nr:hypothetical protein [bacterium]